MNKLLVVEDIKEIHGGEYIFKTNKDVSLEINKSVILHDLDNFDSNLQITINDNSKLDLYQIKRLDNDYHIHIKINRKATFNYHLLILNKNKHKVLIELDMIDNNSLANINVRAINISNNSSLDIICNGYINKNTKDNELVENLKGLITRENDSIKISPNMMVDTNEVTANHLVTIGRLSLEDLFYLKNRGLEEKTAKKLLIGAFLKHGLSEIELDNLNMGGEDFE